MVSAGGSTSSSSSSQDMATLGLGPLLGLGAFGGQFGANQGGLSLTEWPGQNDWEGGQDPFGGGFISPEHFTSMGGLLDPMQLGMAEQMGLAGVPSRMALGSLGRGNAG